MSTDSKDTGFPRTLTRDEAIEALRLALLEMTDEDHSMCQVAAERGLICRGFAQWDDDEFRRRFEDVARRRPLATRSQLERLANTWQLARQIVEQVPISCDVGQRDHKTCRGWDGFSDEQLARYVREIIGESVVVGSARG